MSTDRNRGPGDVPTGERMATVGGAAMDAMKHKSLGEHETEHGAHQRVARADVERLVEDWPDAPKKGALEMLERYGPPNEATPTKLFWYGNSPWKRTVITSDILVHNFPAPHSDFLTQWIDYRVPVERFADIGRYDGSCLVDRTAGEAGARCDSEAANLITLNLMHEIVTGEKSVEQAREHYANSMMAYTMGRDAPYAERLLFTPAREGTEDPDEDMGLKPAMKQAAGKVGDMLTGRDG